MGSFGESGDGSGLLDYGMRVAPFSITYDPMQELLVTFEIPQGDSRNLVTLWIPKGAVDGTAQLEVDLNDKGQFSFEDINLDLRLISKSDDKLISLLKKPLTIRPWFKIRVPRLIENGSCSLQFLPLRTNFLTKSKVAGYHIGDTGLMTLHTRQLSVISNLKLVDPEKLCFSNSKGASLTSRDFNRIVIISGTSSRSLVIDLKEKYANRKVDLYLRRNESGVYLDEKITTFKVNAKGDAVYPYSESISRKDRFFVKMGSIRLAIRTFTITNP